MIHPGARLQAPPPRLVAFPLLLALAAGPLAAAEGAPPAAIPGEAEAAAGARLFFIQLTDPQFGFMEENKGFTREAENLRRAVEHINRLRPAFVVVTGDLIHQPGDAAQARGYLEGIRALDRSIPVIPVAGNHDVGQFPTPESVRWFQTTFGPDQGTLDIGGWRFLWFDSSVLIHPRDCPEAAAAHRTWLLEALRKARAEGLPVGLFQHHPWFVDDPDEKEGYFGFPEPLRKEFLPVLRDSGVRTVFAGHVHRCSRGTYGPLEMVITGPVGKPLGKDPSGLRIVWVFPDRLEHRYYGLEAVPLEVSLLGPKPARRL